MGNLAGSVGVAQAESGEVSGVIRREAGKISKVHVPALDGLRGLAIALVLLTHLFRISPVSTLDRLVAKVLEASRHGVDLFFVLSGFLITGILLDTKSKPRYFVNFYSRRTLRIFPLYYCSLLLVLFVLPSLGILQWLELAPLRSYEWSLWTYCSNIVVAVRSEWTFNSRHVDLDHFWSLAVEEQFYFVWPVVVSVFHRRALAKLSVAMILGAAVLRTVLAIRGVSLISILVLTPCRLDTLAVGALIAIWARKPGGINALRPRARQILWGTLAALPLCLWFHVASESLSQSINYLVLALLFGSLLVVAVSARPHTLNHRIFTSGIMTFLGKYSYGIYVIHALAIPTFVSLFGAGLISRFGDGYISALIYFMLSSSLSCLAAVIVWHLFEQHFLRLKRFFV